MKKLFEEELYSRLPVSDLILFAMFSLNKRCTFEDLVQRCFTFFPKTFSLFGHSKWPDTRKLDRPLRALRDDKMIRGDPSSHFVLTQRGKRRALEIANLFRQGKLL